MSSLYLYCQPPSVDVDCAYTIATWLQSTIIIVLAQIQLVTSRCKRSSVIKFWGPRENGDPRPHFQRDFGDPSVKMVTPSDSSSAGRRLYLVFFFISSEVVYFELARVVTVML